MKKMLMTAVLSMAALTWASQADATPVYLDKYEGGNLTYAGTNADGDWYTNVVNNLVNPSYALGASDYKYVPIAGVINADGSVKRDLLTYSFSENIGIDNTAAADIVLREIGKDTLVAGSDIAKVNVYVSQDENVWKYIGVVGVEDSLYLNQFTDSQGDSWWYADKGVDLTSSGLDWIRYIGFAGVASTGNIYGFDLDSVTGQPVPEPASLLLFGSGALSLFGLRRRKKK